MNIKDIKKRMKEMSGNNVEFYQKLNPTAKKCLGIRVPDLRKLGKEIAKDDYKSFLENNPMEYYDEELLQALVIGYAKDDINVLLDLFDSFIPMIHDWAVNDTLTSTFKIAQKYPKETFKMLSKYFKSKKEFEIRIVSTMLMTYFLNDEYIDEVIKVMNNFKTDDYYAEMGIAFCIATMAAKQPEKCYAYMKSKDNKLNNFTFNKSIQKMQESNRVSDEMKNKMNKLKRK